MDEAIIGLDTFYLIKLFSITYLRIPSDGQKTREAGVSVSGIATSRLTSA